MQSIGRLERSESAENMYGQGYQPARKCKRSVAERRLRHDAISMSQAPSHHGLAIPIDLLLSLPR
jgi:hypothetical protein